jgi:hypothetical protein
MPKETNLESANVSKKTRKSIECNTQESPLSTLEISLRSEIGFYSKVRGIFAKSINYVKNSSLSRSFFQETQNKILWAITGKTASEILTSRANPAAPCSINSFLCIF